MTRPFGLVGPVFVSERFIKKLGVASTWHGYRLIVVVVHNTTSLGAVINQN